MRHSEARGIDQRQHNRYCVEGIRGNILNSNDLEVLNIGVNGAAIETVRRVELNREYTVRMNFHDSSFHIRVRVIWATLTSKERGDKTVVPVYRAGVEFIDVSAEKANLIRNWVAGMEVKVLENRQSRITYCF